MLKESLAVKYSSYTMEWFQLFILENKVNSLDQLRNSFGKEFRVLKLKNHKVEDLKWYSPSPEDLLTGYNPKDVNLSVETILGLIEIGEIKTLTDFIQRFHNCYYQARQKGFLKEVTKKIKEKNKKFKLDQKEKYLNGVSLTITKESVLDQIQKMKKISLTKWKNDNPMEYLVAKREGWWSEFKENHSEFLAKITCDKAKKKLIKLGDSLGYVYLGYDKIQYEGLRKNIYVKVQCSKYPEIVRSIRLHLLKQGQNPFLIHRKSPPWLVQELSNRGEKFGKKLVS